MRASYGKGYWTLIVGLIFATLCLIHIETSRAKATDFTDHSRVTVERMPSSEAREMGVVPRNH